MRDKIRAWLESTEGQNLILWVILLNAIGLGLETSPTVMAFAGPVIEVVDTLCLAFFIAELSLKLYVYGPRFFRSGWNVFDLIVVGLALIPDVQPLSALRALRILRLFRVVSVSPSLRRVVTGLLLALPGMGSVILLLAMIFYIGAVIATKMFGGDFDEWFGTVGRSAYSLFQIMTLESWSMGIVRPVMVEYPYAWAFFVPFIMATSFAVVNLLVGLVVNSLQEAALQQTEERDDDQHEELLARLEAIEARLDRVLARDTHEAVTQGQDKGL